MPRLFFFIFFKILFIFGEGEEREKERERDIDVGEKHYLVAFHTPPTGDQTSNPGMCPGLELYQ